MTPRSRYVTLEGYEIHYVEWGNAAKPPLILWHGLARTCRDFDDLAAAICDEWHILAPDTIGRGLSQWSRAPEKDYTLNFYARLATAFLDAVGLDKVDWIGTSMGGAIAIQAAAGSLKGRIRRLVLNDIGPALNPAAIERIRSYAGKPPAFDKVSELEAYLRHNYKPYGFLTDAQWRRMAETSTRRLPDGRVTTHYDPALVAQFIHHEHDYDQWPQWDALDCDILCLRGADSDLLLAETAEAMTTRGPGCRLETIPGCGHAPALNVPIQFDIITDFLRGG